MPLYEYQCDDCGHRFEQIRKFSDPPLETCPQCGGTIRKLISSPAFQFKGTGWYVSDYGAKKNADKESKDGAKDNDTKETKDKDTKETKDAKSSDGSKESGSKDAAASTSTESKSAPASAASSDTKSKSS